LLEVDDWDGVGSKLVLTSRNRQVQFMKWHPVEVNRRSLFAVLTRCNHKLDCTNYDRWGESWIDGMDNRNFMQSMRQLFKAIKWAIKCMKRSKIVFAFIMACKENNWATDWLQGMEWGEVHQSTLFFIWSNDSDENVKLNGVVYVVDTISRGRSCEQVVVTLLSCFSPNDGPRKLPLKR